MELSNVALATITLARTRSEEAALRKSLRILSGLPFSVTAADGGSREAFVRALEDLGIKTLHPAVSGLVRQVKASLKAALRTGQHPFVLYTEPDKIPFFEGPLREFIAAVSERSRSLMIIPGRNPASFATFPQGQRQTEQFMNDATGLVLGRRADYCYGPLLLARSAAELVAGAPDDLGWGWRFWLMARLSKLFPRSISCLELELPCPKDQRGEDSRKDRIYRLKQLRQNLDGLFSGLEARE